jgi:hypothetical protein
MARLSATGACCHAILSCFSSTVNLKRRDEQVQFASQGCPGERIQSLANRHRLVCRITTSNLDLEPALGGILADYTQFARLAVGSNIVSPDIKWFSLRKRLTETSAALAPLRRTQ